MVSKSPKRATSWCCCLGVKCMCPPGKVCPSMKRDVNRVSAYVKENNLTEEEKRAYISSLYKSMKKKKKSGKKRKSVIKNIKKSSKKKKSARKARK